MRSNANGTLKGSMHLVRIILALALITAGAMPAQTTSAAKPTTEPYPSEIKIPGSIRHDVKSKRNDVTYNLSIFLPYDYNKTAVHYPVIYVLDGGWLAPLIRSLPFPGERRPIVVGIESEDRDHHWQDLPTAGHDRHWDVRPERGAANFLKIVTEEFKPYVDTNFRTDAEDSGIAGHSLGGFFALYAGLHAPETFHHVIAFSPSMIWQDNVLMREQPELSKRYKDMPVRFYADNGGYETQNDKLSALGTAILEQGYASVQWQNRTIANQTHTTVVFADAMDALVAVYGPKLRVIDAAELAQVSGRYQLENGEKLTLRPSDGKLIMVLTEYDDEPVELLSSEPHNYFIKGLGTCVVVAVPGSTEPDIVFYKQGTPGPGGQSFTPTVKGRKTIPGTFDQ